MAVFTPITLNDANELLSAHQLPKCDALTPLHEAGYANTCYKISAGGQDYFLRIYEHLSMDEALLEWRFMEHLKRHAAKTPRWVPATEAYSFKGKPAGLFSFIEGESLPLAQLTAAHMKKLGTALAKVHLAGADFNYQQPSRIRLDNLLAMVSKKYQNYPNLVPEVTPILERTQQLISKPMDGLPMGMIHGDIFYDNLLWDQAGDVWMLDWEVLGWGRFLDDLSLVFLSCTFTQDFNWPLASAFLSGYQELRPLNDAEKNAMRHSLACNCVRFALFRLILFEFATQRAEHLPPRDFRRFLKRLEIIDGMDDAQLWRLLT